MLGRESQQPVDFLDQLDNCLLGQRRAGRPEWGGQVGTFELRDGLLCCLGVFLDRLAAEDRAQVIGNPVQRIAGQRAETGLRRIAPHEKDRQRPDDRRERPALKSWPNRTRFRGEGEGEDQHEHRRDRALGDVPAQDSEEQHEGGREPSDDDRQPGDS